MTYGLSRTGFLFFVVSFLAYGEATADSVQNAALRSEHSSKEQTIVIGRVSDDPMKHFPRLETFANYLAPRLESVGIAAVSVLIAKDNQQMITYLREGKVDLLSETALSALLFVEQAGAELLLREWKKGVPTYRTVLFTRAEKRNRGAARPDGSDDCFRRSRIDELISIAAGDVDARGTRGRRALLAANRSACRPGGLRVCIGRGEHRHMGRAGPCRCRSPKRRRLGRSLARAGFAQGTSENLSTGASRLSGRSSLRGAG